MLSTLSVISSSFGYHSSHSYENSYLYESGFLETDDATIPNLINFLGYIPGFSIGNGIFRCGFAMMQQDHSADRDSPQTVHHFKVLKITQSVRGVVECCGAGIVFLIPDLCVSTARLASCCGRHLRRHNHASFV